jgi:hypothetical protein
MKISSTLTSRRGTMTGYLSLFHAHVTSRYCRKKNHRIRSNQFFVIDTCSQPRKFWLVTSVCTSLHSGNVGAKHCSSMRVDAGACTPAPLKRYQLNETTIKGWTKTAGTMCKKTRTLRKILRTCRKERSS